MAGHPPNSDCMVTAMAHTQSSTTDIKQGRRSNSNVSILHRTLTAAINRIETGGSLEEGESGHPPGCEHKKKWKRLHHTTANADWLKWKKAHTCTAIESDQIQLQLVASILIRPCQHDEGSPSFLINSYTFHPQLFPPRPVKPHLWPCNKKSNTPPSKRNHPPNHKTPTPQHVVFLLSWSKTGKFSW